jgi:hypothetical protein
MGGDSGEGSGGGIACSLDIKVAIHRDSKSRCCAPASKGQIVA